MKVHPYLSTEKVLQAMDFKMPCGVKLKKVTPVPLLDFMQSESTLLQCNKCARLTNAKLAALLEVWPKRRFYLYGLASGQDVRDAA